MNYKVASSALAVNNYIVIAVRTLILLILFFLFTSGKNQSYDLAEKENSNENLLAGWDNKDKEGKKRGAARKKECSYSKHEANAERGTLVKITERERIISHTPNDMLTFFKEEDYLTIDAYLTNVNGDLSLNLRIALNTNDPHSSYGSIYKDDKLIFKLKNGQKITLYSGQSENGNIDYANERSDYMTFFRIDNGVIESLQTSELAMARLYWSKGYEDYKIINPDFFIRQISCAK